MFYHRVRIYGTLTTESTLHIGSGQDKEYLQKKTSSDKTKDDKHAHYSALCQDVKGRPYLPAATLRGFLAEAGKNSPCYHSVFGYDAESKEMQAGSLRVYDALLDMDSFDKARLPEHRTKRASEYTALRTHVTLNPITGVAEAHQLFTLEYVPKDSVFDCHFELEQVDENILSYVLSLLSCWDGSIRSALGSGTGKGRGRVKWNRDKVKVEVLDNESLQAWLKEDGKSLQDAYIPLEEEEISKLTAASKSTTKIGTGIKISLYPTSPFLLNDPEYVKEKDKESDKDSQIPAFEYSRTPNGEALIPATALRGWLRGRARRILLTLLVNKEIAEANEKADKLVNALFGSTEKRGLLQFDDLVSTKVVENTKNEHKQTFNAVDRFTGGVAETALYTARGATCDCLTGGLHYLKSDPLENWQKGLLLLIARDALEGDLVLGWGKGRGYGGFNVGISWESGQKEIKDWEELKKHLEKSHDLVSWLETLHEHLEQYILKKDESPNQSA